MYVLHFALVVNVEREISVVVVTAIASSLLPHDFSQSILYFTVIFPRLLKKSYLQISQ